jgi:hypothetical protein
MLKGGDLTMEQYERPTILATYTVEELVAEAAVCQTYGGGPGDPPPPPPPG